MKKKKKETQTIFLKYVSKVNFVIVYVLNKTNKN